MIKQVASNHDEYIAGFPGEVQGILQNIRETITAEVPEATETIKYGMPSFYFHGNLVYFAGYKKHIGFYPVPTGNPAFDPLFKDYKTGRGSIQFPLDKPIPYDLIKRIVRFRVKQQLQKHQSA